MAMSVPSQTTNDRSPSITRMPKPVESATRGSLASPNMLPERESQVMAALRQLPRLTLVQLAHATGLDSEELRVALEALLTKGLVVRLETVIPSYSCALAGAAVPIA